MLSLLDDSDPEIVQSITDRLMRMNSEEIPRLEKAWEQFSNPELQGIIVNIIHKIQFNTVYEGLENWIENGNDDLLDALILIARYRYPDVKREDMMQEIESIRISAWIDMMPDFSAIEKIQVLNHVFYGKNQFTGNIKNYSSPENSFINEVLKSKKGNPISLACIYSIIARRLGMPVYGVNLPQHFVLAYMDDSEESSHLPMAERPVLFYINAFNNGVVFNKTEIDQFLHLLKLEKHDQFYRPCSNREIISRFFNNLLNAYKDKDPEREHEIELLKSLFDK